MCYLRTTFAGWAPVTYCVLQEAADGRIALPEDDPAKIKLLIQFLYEHDYTPDSLPEQIAILKPRNEEYLWEFPHTCLSGQGKDHEVCPHHKCAGYRCRLDCREFICSKCTGITSEDNPNSLLLHATMYALADKYEVEGLRVLSTDKFRRSCVRFWDHESFAPTFAYALSSTPESNRGLRDVLCDTIKAHPSLVLQSEIAEIVRKYPDFLLGIAQNQAKTLVDLK